MLGTLFTVIHRDDERKGSCVVFGHRQKTVRNTGHLSLLSRGPDLSPPPLVFSDCPHRLCRTDPRLHMPLEMQLPLSVVLCTIPLDAGGCTGEGRDGGV
jgi:hypothetical protein